MIAYRKRQPYISLVNSYLIDSPQPSSLNYWYNLGSLLGLCLVIQIASGIFLAMHYSSHIELAFDSVEHIMRDVNLGWLIRYIHANGASFFFGCMYIHVGKALYYGSYRKPRVLVWIIGVIILIATMATGFMGKSSSPKSLYNMKKRNILNKVSSGKIIKRGFSTLSKLSNKDENNIIYIKENEELSKKISISSKNLFNEIGIKPEIWWENLDEKKVVDDIKEKLKNKSGIYIIINKVSRQYYVGSAHTNNFYKRFNNHLRSSNNKGSIILKKAVKKYGIENFIFGILEYYPYEVNINNNKELYALEISYISLLIPSYNILVEAGKNFGKREININNDKKLINLSLLNERKELLKKLRDKHLEEYKLTGKQRIDFRISTEGNIKGGKNKRIFISNNILSEEDIINNKGYVCWFENVNISSHYLCCSRKIILRSLNLGYIYIPNVFIEYLKKDHIDNHNSIIEYVNKLDLINYKGRKNRSLKIGSKLENINENLWTKFYIKGFPEAYLKY